MQNNKLIQVISGFKRKEMTRFFEFVRSPYFNKHDEVRALIAHLNSIFPDFDEKKCDRFRLFQVLFPGQQHDQSRLALLFTYAYRLLETFLKVEQLQEMGPGDELLLLRQYRERGQWKQYEQTLLRLSKQLAQTKKQNSQYHLHYFQLAEEADRYYNQRGRHEQDHNIQVKQDFLDRYYMAEKLRDACEMSVRRKILKVNYQTRFLTAILEEVSRELSQYEPIPSVWVYYHLFLLVEGKEGITFEEMLRILLKNEHFFEHQEQQLLYNYLQNYCIEQINKGKTTFHRQAFEIYKLQLEKKLIIINGFLSEWHYKNIVTIGLRLGETDWVYQFIHQYKEFLQPKSVRNAFNFNLASWYYQQGQLEEVLELLHQVEHKDNRYSLAAKSLLLRTYYDLDEQEAMFSLLDAFSQYLHRNKVMTDERIKAFRNLLQLTKKAMLLKSEIGFSKPEKLNKELQKLLNSIHSKNAIINQDWLMQKVNELQIQLNA
jgi:hypothetical protein